MEMIKKNSDLGLFLLRFSMGLLFLYGGVGKLFGILGGPGLEMFSGMVWGSMFLAVLVGIVELVAGLMLIVGVSSRIASIFLIVILVVAIFHVHLPGLVMGNLMDTLIRLALIGGLLEILFSGSGDIAIKED